MYIVLLVIGCLSVSSSGIFVNLSDLPSLVLIVYRLFFACLIILPYILIKNREEYTHITPRNWGLFALSGIFFALHLISFFEAVRYTGITEANMLMCTEILFIAAYEWVFKGRKISLLGGVFLAISLVASYFVITGRNIDVGDLNRSASTYLLGNLLAISAAIFSALYTLVGREVRKTVSTPVYTFNLYLIAMLAALLASQLRGEALFGYKIHNTYLAVAMALITNITGHNMFSLCLKNLRASLVSSMKLTVPVFGAVLAYFIFGEIPSLQVVLASLILLFSIGAYIRVEKKE